MYRIFARIFLHKTVQKVNNAPHLHLMIIKFHLVIIEKRCECEKCTYEAIIITYKKM